MDFGAWLCRLVRHFPKCDSEWNFDMDFRLIVAVLAWGFGVVGSGATGVYVVAVVVVVAW